MFPTRLIVIVFFAAMLGYAGLGRATFSLPASLELAEACGFTSADFNAAGQIEYAPTQAWLVSFLRKQEYWSAICVGLAFAFIAFVLSAAKRLGAGVATGAAMGGSLLALGALCLGCLAPVLSVVGLGIASSALAGVPKWIMALNTFLLTGWGTLYLSRNKNACPVTPRRGYNTVEIKENKK